MNRKVMERRVAFMSNGDPSAGIHGQTVTVDYLATVELEPEEIDALNKEIAEILSKHLDDKFKVYNE
jgi:hypothetical protein